MRDPDINRVKQALTLLANATRRLERIKWETNKEMDDVLLTKAKENIKWATWNLIDFATLNNKTE